MKLPVRRDGMHVLHRGRVWVGGRCGPAVGRTQQVAAELPIGLPAPSASPHLRKVHQRPTWPVCRAQNRQPGRSRIAGHRGTGNTGCHSAWTFRGCELVEGYGKSLFPFDPSQVDIDPGDCCPNSHRQIRANETRGRRCRNRKAQGVSRKRVAWLHSSASLSKQAQSLASASSRERSWHLSSPRTIAGHRFRRSSSPHPAGHIECSTVVARAIATKTAERTNIRID